MTLFIYLHCFQSLTGYDPLNRTNEFHAMYNTKYPVPRDLPIIYDAVQCTLADTERVNNLFDCLVVPSTDNCNPATEPAAVACQSLPLPAITSKMLHMFIDSEIGSKCMFIKLL